MIGMGTIANVGAIVLGACIGMLFKGGLKEHYQQAITKSLGLCTLFLGASGALSGLVRVENGALTGPSTPEILGLVLSMSFGTLLGEWLDFDGRMEQLGAWLKKTFTRGDDSQFIQGFVTASLTVCVGAMAIVGSIQDGLSGDPSVLYTKSILDFFIIMIFASSYGKGTIFSALPVGVFQGSVTLCAGLLAPVFSAAVVANLSFLGSILIFCVGVNLTFGTKFRVANMLPAMLLGAVYTALI